MAMRRPAQCNVRWTGLPYMSAGVFRLRAESDDGVRVWVNGILMIDAWRVGAQAMLAFTSGGLHCPPPRRSRERYTRRG
jgi:hypothetical protein